MSAPVQFNPGEVVSLDSFDPTKIKITKISPNKGGQGQSAYLNYNGKKFSLAILETRFPFGVGQKVKDNKGTPALDINGNNQWTIQVEPTAAQIKTLEAFDEYVLEYCLNDPSICHVLLGEQYTKNQNNKIILRTLLEAKYHTLVKYSKDKETKQRTDQYPPKIRCNIPNRNEEFSTMFFKPGEGGKSIPIKVDNINDSPNRIGNLLSGDCSGSILMALSLWATGSGFGVTARALQVKTQPRTVIGSETCLLDSMLEPSQGSHAHVTHEQLDDPEGLDDLDSHDIDAQFEDEQPLDEELAEEELVEDEELLEEEEVVEPPAPVAVAPKPAAKVVRRVAAKRVEAV